MSVPEHSHPQRPPAEHTPAERSLADRVLAARMLRALKTGSDVRRRKVRRLRGAIRAMEYENPLKVQVALDRLSSDLRPTDPPPPERTS